MRHLPFFASCRCNMVLKKDLNNLPFFRRRPLFEGRSFRPTSQWWKNVLDSKDVFKSGLSFGLGDGLLIDFWFDRWCGDTSLKSRFLDIFAFVDHKEARVGEYFSLSGWRWRKMLRGARSYTEHSRRRTKELKTVLANFRGTDQPDVIFWRWNLEYNFTVKYVYSLVRNGGVKDVATPTI